MKELMCPKEMPSENLIVEKCATPVSDEQRKEDAKEHRKQTRREYYLKNRERINAKSKEYYYANREHLLAQKREYHAANREHMRAWRQKYYAVNRERLCAKMREYGAANRERLLAENRDYRIKNNDKLALKRKKRYENNKYTLCHNLLNRDLFKGIEQARCLYPEKVNHYMLNYPFEEYAERHIKGELYRNGIYLSQDHYADCYDAGMLAYLYSIHRCAAMDYTYVVAYIKKLVKICIICALVVYREAKNLCKTNGFRQIQLDATDPGRGY